MILNLTGVLQASSAKQLLMEIVTPVIVYLVITWTAFPEAVKLVSRPLLHFITQCSAYTDVSILLSVKLYLLKYF